jgi:DNA-binding GntR family transcriptional regulator
VADQVMTELRRSILSGALAPGREFSLRELAEMLQVSIIPVREALRSLENQGLVQMRPGRSAVVAPLDLDELQSIYRLRRRLEPEIAQRSCRLLSAAELDRLQLAAEDFGDEERDLRLAPHVPPRAARAGRDQLGHPDSQYVVAGLGAVRAHRLGHARPGPA